MGSRAILQHKPETRAQAERKQLASPPGARMYTAQRKKQTDGWSTTDQYHGESGTAVMTLLTCRYLSMAPSPWSRPKPLIL